jgi:hypothetical protein
MKHLQSQGMVHLFINHVNISSTLKQHQKHTEKPCEEAQNDKTSEVIHKGCWDPEYRIYKKRDYVRRISAYCGNSG